MVTRLSSVRILIERAMHHRPPYTHSLSRSDNAGVKIEEMEDDGSRARLQFTTSRRRNYKYK